MSRIDEALRRARPASGGTSHAPTKAWPAGQDVSQDEAAESPWSFDKTAEPAPAHTEGAQVTPIRRQTGATASVSGPVPSARREAQPIPEPKPQDGLPVFGGFDRSIEERVIISKSMPPVSVEQYRRLAATLHHAQADRGIKRVMITSAVTGEGKSLTATNLALTLSQSYRRRVLLIDADLRRPSMHRIFQVQNVFGLTEGLKSRDERQLAIVEISEQLSLLTAGRPDPDPMSGLTSDRMRRILNEASTKFDWIVIDTPPVALLPDANLLAAMVDVAVLVVGATRTPYDLVQRAVESIGRDKIMGVVLNRVEDTGFTGDAHYHSYYEAYHSRS